MDGGGGLLYGLASGVASGLWSVLTLGIGTTGAAADADDVDPAASAQRKKALLADQSLHLILILANHCTPGEITCHNPYRQVGVVVVVVCCVCFRLYFYFVRSTFLN